MKTRISLRTGSVAVHMLGAQWSLCCWLAALLLAIPATCTSHRTSIRDGVLLRDGVPFTPFGLYVYGLNSTEWNFVQSCGYNTVITYTNGCAECCESQCLKTGLNQTIAFLDAAAAHGISVILSVKDLYPITAETDSEYRSVVQAFSNHSALLAWYVNDEMGPSASVIDMLTKRNNALQAADPHHVTLSIVDHWISTSRHASGVWPSTHYIKVYENTSLVLGADPYPWRNASSTHDLSVEAWEISDVVSAFGPKGNRLRATTCVAQLFDYGAFKPLSLGWTEPPFAVKRAMTWLELVMGCGGVLQYCWKDQFLESKRAGQPAVAANSSTVARRMKEMQSIGTELLQYLHLFASGERNTTDLHLSVSGGNHTHAALFGGDQNKTLFVVNAANAKQTVDIEHCTTFDVYKCRHMAHKMLQMGPWDVQMVPVPW